MKCSFLSSLGFLGANTLLGKITPFFHSSLLPRLVGSSASLLWHVPVPCVLFFFVFFFLWSTFLLVILARGPPFPHRRPTAIVMFLGFFIL